MVRWASARSRSGRAAATWLLVALALLLALPPIGPSTAPTATPAPVPPGSPGTAAATSPLVAAQESLVLGEGPADHTSWSCSGSGVAQGMARCGPIPSDHPASSPGAASVGWRKLGPLNVPMAPIMMTYDAADHYVLALQAPPGNVSALGWKFADGAWSPLLMFDAPAICFGSTMAYDPSAGSVVYVSGVPTGLINTAAWPGCSYPGTTWTFRAGNWTRLAQQAGAPVNDTIPQQSAFPGLVYDPHVSGLVMFGGVSSHDCSGPGCFGNGYRAPLLNATWVFAQGNWTEVSSAGRSVPPERVDPSMAFDASSGEVTLFGGYGGNGSGTGGNGFTNYTLGDTWGFANNSWTRLSSSGGPPGVAGAVFASDPAHGGLLLFPASGWVSSYADGDVAGPNSTWEFANGSWSRLSPTVGPPAGQIGRRLGAFNTSSDEVILLADFQETAGAEQAGHVGYRTWAFANGSYRNLSDAGSSGSVYAHPEVGTGPYGGTADFMAYDAADQEVVLLGGLTGGETWVFAHAAWQRIFPHIAPPIRNSAAVAYDAADGYVVLFGGTNGSTGAALADTWEFSGGQWANATTSVAPQGGSGRSLVFDGSDNYLLLVAPPSYTWSFRAGTWTNRTASAGMLPAFPANPLVDDNATGAVEAFGFYDGVDPNMTYEFRSGSWINETQNVTGPAWGPPGLVGVSFLYDPALGGVVAFGGMANGTSVDSSNRSWLFQRDNWTVLAVGGAPPASASTLPFAYDPPDREGVLTGFDRYFPPCSVDCGASWIWGNGSSSTSRPVIRSVTWSTGSLEVGVPATLTVDEYGDLLPLTFAYSGLPPGCASVNSSTVRCTPSRAGQFDSTVSVTDTAGNWSTSQFVTSVMADPSIVQFAAQPASMVLGNLSRFYVTIANGTGPFLYQYSSLPPGCPAQDVPILPCAPGAAGNFTVGVTVTDARNESASAQLNLSVWPGGLGTDLRVYGYLAVPGEIVLGNSTTFEVNATRIGGGPIQYAYVGLPPGCSANDSSRIDCTPTQAGFYQPTVSVNDSTGASVSLGTDLLIDPAGGGLAPTVYSFRIDPPVVSVGGTVTLTVNATSVQGTTSAYRYLGLPTGCTGANQSTYQCVPGAAGNFRVQAVVISSTGHAVSVIEPLRVTGTSISRPPHGPPGVMALGILGPYLLAGTLIGVAIVLPVVAVQHRRRRLRDEGDELLRELISDEPEPGVDRPAP